jgi:hypothetical protein
MLNKFHDRCWTLVERNANRLAASQRNGALVLRDGAFRILAVF